jgi:hypothetical protein
LLFPPPRWKRTVAEWDLADQGRTLDAVASAPLPWR